MAEIIRYYSTADRAEGALATLRGEGLAEHAAASAVATSSGTAWQVSVRPPFGTGQRATDILEEFEPTSMGGAVHAHGTVHGHYAHRDSSPDLDSISRLSGPVSPGAISHLSGHVDARGIAAASRPRPAGAIASLSGRRSPGAISRLSRRVSPGSISRLSQPGRPGSIAHLSSGWYFSKLFGLPLLTHSQRPIEPDASLLTDRHINRRD